MQNDGKLYNENEGDPFCDTSGIDPVCIYHDRPLCMDGADRSQN